jgi:mRNA interferase MazF
MTEGDIVIAKLPQDNGQLKSRPVVLPRQLPNFGDFLACGISTQLKQKTEGFDDIIMDTDDDFKQSGLRTTSLIRLGFLSGLSKSAIQGTIGSISEERHERLLEALSLYLIKRSES